MIELDNKKCQTCAQCWTGRCDCPEFKAALRQFRKNPVHELAKQILVIE